MDRQQSTSNTFDYDIAVSFASEDRAYVNDVVEALKARGIRVFYDEDAMADIWGSNLIDFLDDIYRRRARYALIFVSRHYVAKKWTTHERQSAQDRALDQVSPYILPVRLDDTELPGLHSSIGYVDARRLGIAELVQLVVNKLAKPTDLGQPQTPPTFDGKVPRTASAIGNLLAMRPPGWEWLLFAAILLDENQKLDDKYRDHIIRYSRQPGRVIDDIQVPPEVSRRITELDAITRFFTRLLDKEVQRPAFGRPGVPGNPDRIRHLAIRMCSLEEDLMDWGASVRATDVSSIEAKRVFETLGCYADQPIESIRNFIDNYAKDVDVVYPRVVNGENILRSFTIEMTFPEAVTSAFNEAMSQYVQSRKS